MLTGFLGIFNNIFDGIQRPLEAIAQESQSVFIPRGIEVPKLDQEKLWPFVVNKDLQVGSIIKGGDVLGVVDENPLFREHKIMVEPNVSGRITEIVGDGMYNVRHTVCVIEKIDGSGTKNLSMSHFWPVRKPRPVIEKMQASEPLLTGQRVLDALYPSTLGGTCAIPGAFGCGKTCISQALSKYSNSACVVYVGCGERGNEMAEVLEEFPALTTKDEEGTE